VKLGTLGPIVYNQIILTTFTPSSPMTQLLEQAISHIKTLSPDRQDAIATLILEELQDEQRWEQSFARSPDLLAQLAATAMDEYHAGQTQPLDLETL
jgi:hypothetical protein